MDAATYLDLIKNRAIPSIKRKLNNYYFTNEKNFDPSNVIFVQDNASPHTANKNNDKVESVLDVFKNLKIEVEKWPAKSPGKVLN